MASSGNFATFNPLKYKASSYTTSSFANNNLQLASGTGNAAQLNFGFRKGDGKFYFEVYAASIPSSLHYGVCIGNADLNNVTAGKAIIGYRHNSGNKLLSTAPQTNSTQSSYGATYSGGDIMGCAVDFTNGTIEFYKNNASQGQFSWSSANDGSTYYPYVYQNTGVAGVNCGQDSSFCGLLTAQGNSDENGFGDFYYTPPSGFLAMCSGNLPLSDDIDPAQTDDDFVGGKHFNVVEYTGNANTGQSITGMGFKPDLLICKMTSSSQNWQVYDSSRLNSRSTPFGLRTDTNGAEFDDQSTGNNNEIISSFDTDGFTLGTSGSGPNDSGRTYNAFGFRANGGTTSSNSNGSITSTVQANTNAGFSIITWTATGSNGSIGHGLSQKPDMFWIKKRNGSSNWAVYHTSLGATKYLVLNNTNAASTFQYTFNNTEPDATKIYLGDNGITNHPSGDTYICYAWHSVPGFSYFNSYLGTGNTDGTYTNLGFKPKWFFGKKSSEASTTYGWWNFNTTHQTSNQQYFSGGWFDTSAAFSGNYPFDILSNGVKHRNNNTNLDGSGKTYIFGAWGDQSGKYSNAF